METHGHQLPIKMLGAPCLKPLCYCDLLCLIEEEKLWILSALLLKLNTKNMFFVASLCFDNHHHILVHGSPAPFLRGWMMLVLNASSPSSLIQTVQLSPQLVIFPKTICKLTIILFSCVKPGTKLKDAGYRTLRTDSGPLIRWRYRLCSQPLLNSSGS